MNKGNEELKREHEVAVAMDSVAHLRAMGYVLTDPRPGDTEGKREPDTVCDSPYGSVGVEIADAYYDARVAKDLWELAGGKGPPKGSRGFVNPDRELVRTIKRVIRKHCSKQYSTRTTFLVVDVAHAPLTTDDDASVLLQHIHVPSECVFGGVWLRLKKNASGETVLVEVTNETNDPKSKRLLLG